MKRVDEFERLAVPHMDAAFSLALWLTRSRADAEDVVQEAYLRACRGFTGFSGHDIKPWLLAIVRNVAYRALGRIKRASNVISFDEAFQTDLDDEPAINRIASDEPSPEQLVIDQGERTDVIAAMEALAPALREVLVLRELEGMPYREIASVIGAPVGTVMSRLARGREQLRRVLVDYRKKEA